LIKLTTRTDEGSAGGDFARAFWLSSLPKSLGKASVPPLLESALLLAWRIVRRDNSDEIETRLLSTLGLSLLPGLLHAVFFMQHSAIHDFAALKLAVPLSIIPFALAPVLLIRRFAPGDFASRPAVIVASIAALTVLFVGVEHPRALDRFVVAGSASVPVPSSLGEAIRRHVAHGDVPFSPDFQVPAYPSWTLCYSMKRVYPAVSPGDIRERSRRISRPHRTLLLPAPSGRR